jgi:hypothetical protein
MMSLNPISSLESHPCASALANAFFAALEYRTSPEEFQHFFQQYRVVLRFMNSTELNQLRQAITQPNIRAYIDQELTIRRRR